MSGPVASGLEIRDLRKRYGDTIALAGLDLHARPGEILGIAGPNGAGKSTVIKILAAEVDADAGQILVDGQAWSPSLAIHRVAVVHQEPQLFPNLTVEENIVVGRERRRVLRHGANEAERALMADLAIAEFAHRRLGGCSLAVQQRTEIARALAQDARLFLFDEPNSALTDEESDDLFRRMHALARAGHVVMLVSHRLAELVAHADRVAVIRDGRVTATLQGQGLTQDAIARQLVLGQPERQVEEADADPVDHAQHGSALTLSGWTHLGGEFRDVDLAVDAGEIVALAGVEGSGARELLRSIAGLERATGTMRVTHAPEARGRRLDAAYVSADRSTSLYGNLSVGENAVVRLSGEIAGPAGSLRPGQMREIATRTVQRFLIKTRSITQPIRSLSGGNQQKVAIASAVNTRPRVLVLEEPTRGVDIQSKREIYRILRAFARSGHAIVIYCTEVTEVFDVADRVHVVADGRIADPLRVPAYPDVESLASDITALERSPRASPELAATAAAG